MPEIGTPGLMSGDGKRGVGHRPQATAPILELYLAVKNKTLRYNAHGGLTIYLGNKSPGQEKEANWLPAPAGNFSLGAWGSCETGRRVQSL